MSGVVKLFGAIMAFFVMVGANPTLNAVVQLRDQKPVYKTPQMVQKKSVSASQNTSVVGEHNFSTMTVAELEKFLFEADTQNPAMQPQIQEARNNQLMQKIVRMTPEERAAFEKNAQKAYEEFQARQPKTAA